MRQAGGQCSRSVRARRAFGFFSWRWLAVLLLALGATGQARAACSTTESFSVASSGSYTVTCENYAGGDFGWDNTTQTAPSHGSVTIDDAVTGNLTYTNNGDGATSDTFSILRGSDAQLITFNVTIAAPVSTITVSPASLPAPTIGTAYSQTLTASGGTGPYTYSLGSGSLPSGLSLSSGGVISGTPTTQGAYSFTVHVVDSATPTAATADKSYSVTVPAPSWVLTPNPLPAGTISIAYSQQFSLSGGIAPYTYVVDSGSTLPAGLSLSSSGLLSGTPTSTGSFSFSVKYTDSYGNWNATSVSLTVNAAPTITITPTTVANATVGTAYPSTSFTASGGTAPYTYSVSAGSLPSGMSLSSGGTLSGTPTQAGTFNFTVQATDANSFTGTQAITLTVNAPTITVGPGTISNPQVGVPYSQQFTASGGTQGSGYTFAATGTVPAGLSLSSGGLLSGTPTSATGSNSFTVTATDQSTGTGAPFSGSQGYTVSVTAPTLAISPASGTTLTAATQNSSYSQQFTASGGTSPYAYQVAGGTLPNGLSLSSGGLLSGTPTEAGTFTFTVAADDSSTGTGSPFSVSGSYTLDVQAIAPVANPVSDTVTYGSSANVVPTSFSGGTPTSVAIASAASHGTATASGTTITYTPISGYTGTDSFTYTGTNTAGTSAPATVSITVSGPTLAITSSSGGTSLTATVGQSFTQTFTFSGGKAPYQGYSITGIPAGLSVTGFNNTSITISGTPTVSGTFTLKVSGTDSSTGTDPSSGKNAPFTVSQSFTLQINAASMSLSPASGSLTNATAGAAYNQAITASGGIAPYTYSVTSGALPAGMSLSASGTLSGTPTAGGSFNFTVTATDSSTGAGSPATASASYALTVDAPTITVTPTALPDAVLGSTYSQTLAASGGNAPYSYAVSGALPPGMSLSSGGALTGTPTTSGTYNFTVTATDSSSGTGPYSGSRAYTLAVTANPIVTPASLPAGTAGTAYSQMLSASGGTAPYTYAVTGGSLPAGIALSSSGALTGTPSVAGSFSFTVTVTDSHAFTGSRAYTLTIAAPVVTVTPATLPGGTVGTAYSQGLSASGGAAPYTYAVTSGSLPGGLSLSGGGALAGTPTAAGNFTFTVTATDSLGFAGNRAYTLAVTAAAPVAVDDAASTLEGQPVTIAVTANDSGSITGVAIARAPAHGATTVSGTSVVYTPAGGFDGTDSFTYTASGPGGTSATATVTVTVHPVPHAVSMQLDAVAGSTLKVDLTSQASGGPFTGAALVSLAPVDSGSAQIAQNGGSYRLTYTPSDAFSGTATIRYTLSNAYATSATATITVTVRALPDPTRDAEVMGVLGAQVDSARRMAQGQLGNFQQRLESLHGRDGRGGFHNGLSLAPTARAGRRAGDAFGRPGIGAAAAANDPASPPAEPDATAPPSPASSGGVTLWTGGAINFGTQKLGGSRNGVDFHTDGITVGADKRLAPNLAVGAGVGYGHDSSDIGDHGSRNTTDAYSAALYGSYQPATAMYVDALVGYQRLTFDARRYVGATGGDVYGHRSGTQWFGSLAVGYEHAQGAWQVSPYGRLDMASARLAGYTESGDSIYALRYDRMTVDTGTASLGLRASVELQRDFGTLTPLFRVEYQHDFQQSGNAALRYANILSSPVYRADVGDRARNHTLLGLGLQVAGHGRLNLRLEYQNLLDSGTRDNQSLQFNLAYPFGP